MERAITVNTLKNRILTQLDGISQLENQLNEKERIYKEIKESLEKYSEYVKIIDDTKELITNAYEKLKKDFSPVVSELAGKVFSFVTDNKDESIVVSSDLNLSVRRSDGFYSLSNLSRSTLDLIYFSFRMAVIQMIIGDGVVIFDEAFIRYDKERLKRLFEYLKESKHQIIFTSFSLEEKAIIENGQEYNLIQI